MKKTIVSLICIFTMVSLAACSGDAPSSPVPVPEPVPNTVAETTHKPEGSNDIKVISNIDENAEDGEDFSESEDNKVEDAAVETESKEAENNETETNDEVTGEVKGEKKEKEEAKSDAQPIVWLGDSLTQGSLGEEDDNLANAPYVRLAKKVSVPVEGYGMFGFNTNDIFRHYTSPKEMGKTVDPNTTYILWVGSNDWVAFGEPNADTGHVMQRIDQFLAEGGGIKQYIVMGTTSRYKLGDLYIPINRDLAAHYGVHYMDVIDIINQYGYSPDNTHLSQASYDAIADAVYAKLKALGYI